MILVVDEHNAYRRAFAEHLREDGFSVREFRSPREIPPLETLSGVSLVITDYRMPGENGLDFADRFHAAHPCVPVLMVTAYWERELQRQVLARDNLYLLCKPVDHVLLSRLVDDLCVDRIAEVVEG